MTALIITTITIIIIIKHYKSNDNSINQLTRQSQTYQMKHDHFMSKISSNINKMIAKVMSFLMHYYNIILMIIHYNEAISVAN